MPLKNRFIRAATWEGLAAPDGSVTPELIEMMVALAKGGVGLIISSHSYVSRDGQGTPWQLGVYKDELVPGLKEMTAAVHKNGGKMILQLAHAGQYAEEKLTGAPPLVVSEPGGFPGQRGEILTKAGIRRLIGSYEKAAQRALNAGFDGIEIHSAHGYLLSQFLSPAYNQRQDEYGGGIENRIRIHRQIYDAVRARVGKACPVLIKMNCDDFADNGFTIEDSLKAAKHFSDMGIDGIEVSGGIIRTGKHSPSRPGILTEDKEAYFKEYARRFKERVTAPLILVGGLRSFTVADRIIRKGIADYISMSRPLIREPVLIRRWQNGDMRRSECRSDNLCFNPGFEGKGISCLTREIEKKGRGNPEMDSRFS